jgi:hypothetical protein
VVQDLLVSLGQGPEGVRVGNQGVDLREQGRSTQRRHRPWQRAGEPERRLRSQHRAVAHAVLEAIATTARQVVRLSAERLEERVGRRGPRGADDPSRPRRRRRGRVTEGEEAAQTFGWQPEPDDTDVLEASEQAVGQVARHHLGRPGPPR